MSRLAESAAARRVDLEDVSRLHLRLADVLQRLDAAVDTHHAVDAHLARLAARHAERTVLAAVGQDACGHRLDEAHAPHAAIAAAPLSPAAGARANLVALQAHREAELQHLRIGE